MTPIDKIDSLYLRYLPIALTVVSLSVLSNKLAMMQLGGCFAAGAASVTSLFGVTSLMYARARTASDSQELEKRAKIADECLKLTLIALLGFTITAFCFFSLTEHHAERIGHIIDPKTPPETEPAILAFLCALFFWVPIAVKMRIVIEMTVANLGLGPDKWSKDTTLSEEKAN